LLRGGVALDPPTRDFPSASSPVLAGSDGKQARSEFDSLHKVRRKLARSSDAEDAGDAADDDIAVVKAACHTSSFLSTLSQLDADVVQASCMHARSSLCARPP